MQLQPVAVVADPQPVAVELETPKLVEEATAAASLPPIESEAQSKQCASVGEGCWNSETHFKVEIISFFSYFDLILKK